MHLLRISVSVFVIVGSIGASFAAGGQEPKIGFILSTFQEERYQKDQKYFIEEAKKLGFEPIVVSAENNAQKETAKVEDLLSQGVKALVIQPVDSEAAGNLVRLAHDDKVPVIAYDRLIKNSDVDFYVTQNSFQVGVLQAKAAVEATHEKGNYVILMGQAGHSVANEITRGVESVLKKYPAIKVVMKRNHNAWSPQEALASVENALETNKDNIQAILANNSGMAHGAIQALAERSLIGKVFVAGADADLASIKDVVAKKQQLEILKDIAPLAQQSADVAYKLALGQKVTGDSFVDNGKTKVPTINTPVYPITKDNVDERIVKTGFHSHQAVYGK